VRLVSLFVALVVAHAAVSQVDFRLRHAPNPKRYLREIPLGLISPEQVANQLGLPAETAEVAGQLRWMYIVSQEFGRISYTYVFVDGFLIDVIYNAPLGPNGISAKVEQRVSR
jgi:hypothetical protein